MLVRTHRSSQRAFGCQCEGGGMMVHASMIHDSQGICRKNSYGTVRRASYRIRSKYICRFLIRALSRAVSIVVGSLNRVLKLEPSARTLVWIAWQNATPGSFTNFTRMCLRCRCDPDTCHLVLSFIGVRDAEPTSDTGERVSVDCTLLRRIRECLAYSHPVKVLGPGRFRGFPKAAPVERTFCERARGVSAELIDVREPTPVSADILRRRSGLNGCPPERVFSLAVSSPSITSNYA